MPVRAHARVLELVLDHFLNFVEAIEGRHRLKGHELRQSTRSQVGTELRKPGPFIDELGVILAAAPKLVRQGTRYI